MPTLFIAIESLFDLIRVAEIWPESIATNDVFLEQITQRKELNERLENTIDCLPRPDMPLETAINQGYVTKRQATELYEFLSILLESGQDYRRLVLYLPFEFLSKASASDRFKKAYMEAWKSLLSAHDVRANFVDGDVIELEKRVDDLPRVVKAAHLIPKLVENGLMEVKDAIALMEESNDQILKNSIADTLPVLADMGFITEKEIKFMEKSEDRLIGNMARIIVSNMKMKAKEKQTKIISKTITFSSSSIQKELDDEFSRIDTQDYGDITKKREIWLRQKKKQEVIEVFGKDISAAIIKDSLEDKTVKSFLTFEADTLSQQVLVEGIRKAVESVGLTDLNKARLLFTKYREILLTLWENNDPETNETLSKTFRRFRNLGIIDNKQLAQLNIDIPKLAGPFSENLKSINEEMSDIQNMVASAESNPELSHLIYPTVLIFGSCLKGYGRQKADIDIGIFVKPGTSFNNRVRLQELLKENFTHKKIRGEIVEFWLEEKENQLKIIDFTESDVTLGKSYWAHILFGAAWKGNKDIMRELREKLLAPYMYDTGKVIHERDARSLYLEEIERDTLQYRLMHKGYERFFPPCGGIHTPHSDEIDGNSMFWDSGYRQLATKLFASRVFLPKIPINKK